MVNLATPARRRFTGAERGSRLSQGFFISRCDRMRAPEHASRGPFRLLERRHGLAEIVERGGGVAAERLRVKRPQTDRDVTAVSGNASRHGNCSAQQRPGFFEALETNEGQRVVVGC